MSKITQDEGWRKIKESIVALLIAYGVDMDNGIDDMESDLESFVREHGKDE